MFSYNTMFSVHGDTAFADRAERIAYNALPATWASPKGGDVLQRSVTCSFDTELSGCLESHWISRMSSVINT